MEQRISLITLGVADLARSRQFYERLGWRRSVTQAQGVVFFQIGGMALALWPRTELAADAGAAGGQVFSAIALSFNTRSRGEVDAVLAEAEAAGARMLRPPVDTSFGGYAGYFADPDGFMWEVCWNPGFAIAADGSITLPD